MLIENVSNVRISWTFRLFYGPLRQQPRYVRFNYSLHLCLEIMENEQKYFYDF